MGNRYKDRDWLYKKFVEEELTTVDLGEICDVNPKTVWNWVDKYDLMRYRRPWDCEQLMHYLYVEKEYSIQELCNAIDGTPPNVIRHLEKHGIETRQSSRDKRHGVFHYIDENGYERVESGEKAYLHSLLAVAKGHDPHKVFSTDYHVHHKNGHTFDNRPCNIELLTQEEHLSRHTSGENNNSAKLTQEDVDEIRHKYDNTDMTQTDLADEYGISQTQVSDIVRHEVW